ncbi:MAG TPA: hypothetical protein VH415_16350 [Nitrososphaeraceae archaeon]
MNSSKHSFITGGALAFIFANLIVISSVYGASAPQGIVASKNFTISNMTTVPHSSGNTLDVIGILTNIGDVTTSHLKVIVQAYNSSNQLIGVSEGFPSYSVLNPEQSTPFLVPTEVPSSIFHHYIVRVGQATDNSLQNNNQQSNSTTLSSTESYTFS